MRGGQCATKSPRRPTSKEPSTLANDSKPASQPEQAKPAQKQLSRRDEFAKDFASAMLRNGSLPPAGKEGNFARTVVRFVDAFLAELDAPGN